MSPSESQGGNSWTPGALLANCPKSLQERLLGVDFPVAFGLLGGDLAAFYGFRLGAGGGGGFGPGFLGLRFLGLSAWLGFGQSRLREELPVLGAM